MLKSVGASTQPCFTPFQCHWGDIWCFSIVLHAGRHAIVDLVSIVINLSGHTNLAIIFQRPSLLTVLKAFVRSTKVGLEVPVLFLALLLELSSCKDYVHYASTSAEASLTLREMSLLEVLYEAVEEDSDEDLASSGQQRYTPVIFTGLADTFLYKGVQWRHPWSPGVWNLAPTWKVQAKLHRTQNDWLSKKAQEIQGYADREDLNRLYDALKLSSRISPKECQHPAPAGFHLL